MNGKKVSAEKRTGKFLGRTGSIFDFEEVGMGKFFGNAAALLPAGLFRPFTLIISVLGVLQRRLEVFKLISPREFKWISCDVGRRETGAREWFPVPVSFPVGIHRFPPPPPEMLGDSGKPGRFLSVILTGRFFAQCI